MGRPGVLFLGDLGPYGQSARRGVETLAAMGLPAGPLVPPTVALPSPLVVVADTPEQLETARPWLADATWTLVRPEPTDSDEEELWEHVLSEHVGTVLRGTAGLDVALDAAREAATPGLPEPADRPLGSGLPPGPWLDWPGEATFETADTRIARALRTSAERIWLHEAGVALDLRSGERSALGGPIDPERVARGDWSLGAERFPGPYGRWVCGDPLGRVAWSGMRCTYSWWLQTRAGLRPWVPSEHDWPFGHAKKLWGYEDNDPVRFELSADGVAALGHYEHDVMLSGLPLRWRQMGDLLVGVRFATPRAVFYVSDGVRPGDPLDPEDEDARHRAPVVALGSLAGDGLYAVGFERSTYRLVEGRTPERLGDEGWAVYGSDHRLVSLGFDDRLIGGSGGALYILQGDVLTREHRGASVPIVEPGHVDGAVPVVDRTNLVLWRGGPADLQVRLV